MLSYSNIFQNSVHFHAHGHSHTVPHHDHSHPNGETCKHTPIDIDADLEHAHRLHNHMHHNLHQHVSNEISAASSATAINQTCSNNKNSTCVPCAYSNDIRPTTTLIGHEVKGDLLDTDENTQVPVINTDSQGKTDANSISQQLKSK